MPETYAHMTQMVQSKSWSIGLTDGSESWRVVDKFREKVYNVDKQARSEAYFARQLAPGGPDDYMGGIKHYLNALPPALVHTYPNRPGLKPDDLGTDREVRRAFRAEIPPDRKATAEEVYKIVDWIIEDGYEIPASKLKVIGRMFPERTENNVSM